MFCIFTALTSIYITPFLDSDSYFYSWNLALLHIILFVPILIQTWKPEWSRVSPQTPALKISLVYGLIAVGNMLFHVSTYQNLPTPAHGYTSFRLGLRWTLPKDLILAPFVNPAQTSITADVLFAILLTWKYWQNEGMEMDKFLLWALATIYCGIPAMAPMCWMMLRNDTENAFLEEEAKQKTS